jgi:hypothetical protein
MQPPPDPLRLLRRHHRGVLLASGSPAPRAFVVEPASGRLVMPLSHLELDADELVLFVPDEASGSLQLLLIPERIARDAACDRWVAWHGRPEHPAWARMAVDCARLGAQVIDGEAVCRPSPLAADEPAMCRWIAARDGAIASLCRLAGHLPRDAFVGTVDHLGIDIVDPPRILRIEFDAPAETRARAEDAVTRLLLAAESRP